MLNRHYLLLIFMLYVSVPSLAQKFEYCHNGVWFTCKILGTDVLSSLVGMPDNNSVAVLSFTPTASDVVIPARMTYYNSVYKVKRVSTNYGKDYYDTKSLVLEEGIEEIDNNAFKRFPRLCEITLPSSLRKVGHHLFYSSNLKMHLASNLDEAALRKGKSFKPGTTMPKTETVQGQKKESKSLIKVFGSVLSGIGDTMSGKNEKESTSDETVSSTKVDEPQAIEVPKVNNISDIDKDIPSSGRVNNKTFCVIVANENYSDVPNVEYANRDGEIFKMYCQKTLGIPEKNIKTFYDATYTTIRRAVNWMQTTAKVTGGQSKMIFYYAGHGMPGEKDDMAYILPTDGIPQDVNTCYKLSDFYERLGEIESQQVVVLMDACFSGMSRGVNSPLLSARAVAVETKEEVLSGNTIVFTATSGDETAMSYQEMQHGLFTYFLLEKLRETKGKAPLGELFESIAAAVKKNSWLENEKLQSPSINVSPHLNKTWKNLHF